MSWPTTPRPQSVLIESFEPSLFSTTQSLKRIVRLRGGHRWYVKTEYSVLIRSEWAPLNAYAQSLRGIYDKFSYVIAGVGEAGRGTMLGTPVVDAIHAAGVRTVNVKGMTNSAPLVFRADDYVKFAGHAKVYKVTADANADGSGKVTLAIMPDLVAALANNEAITYASVPMQCALLTDRHGIKYGGGLVAREGMTYEMIEDPYS